MKYIFFIILGTFLLSSGCAGTNKRLKSSKKTSDEASVSRTLASAAPIPIREVEEKLVPVEEKAPDPYRYFVIIGSFRNMDNAVKYQGKILTEGFKSVILRNESGLYRVSVMATDEVVTAREEIGRIRTQFPEYNDTWLLIQKF